MSYLQDYFKDKVPKIEESLERFFEKLKSNEILQRTSPDFIKAIYKPCKEAVIDTGGKRLRPILTYLSHDLVGGNFKQLDDLAIISELAHKGSIVIDDVQDEAQQRDGRKPIYKSYGTATALNTGGFLYFVPILILNGIEIDKQKRLEILEDCFDGGVIAHIGQGLDIYWKGRMESCVLPNEEEYIQMCANKISTFMIAAKFGATVGNATKEQKESLVKIVELMGTAFQLKDDLLSLDPNANDYGDDIRQGKITLMLLRTLGQKGEENSIVPNILSLEPDKISDDAVVNVINIMSKDGSIDYTKKKVSVLTRKAQQNLKDNFSDSYHTKVFSELIDYCISRNK